MSINVKEKLSPETYEKVMSELGDDVKLFVNDGTYIPKSRLNEESEKRRLAEEKLSATTSTLDELKATAGQASELSEKVNELNSMLEQKDSEFQQQLELVKKESKFEAELSKLKPKNEKAVRALFELDNIKLDGDNLLGFTDQAKEILEANPFLFESDKKSPPQGGSGGQTPPNFKNPFAKEHFNMGEQIKLKRTNPELYGALKAEAKG